MFNSNTSSNSLDTRIAVIEEKTSVSERKMSTIELAIQTISETSQTISKMLAIHEQKIEVSQKSDERIIEKINQLEIRNSDDHRKVMDKLESVEHKFEEKDRDLHNKLDLELRLIETDLKGQIKDLKEKDMMGIIEELKDVSKIKWATIGSGTILAILAAAMASLASGWWTPSEMQTQHQNYTQHSSQASDN